MSPKMIDHRFELYGKDNCFKAYTLNTIEGEGASSIALQFLPEREDGKNWTTRQVDAMIATWEAYIKNNSYILLSEIG